MSWHWREFDRKEKNIVRFRKPQRASAVAAIAAVLALAVTLFLSRGVMDAVLMIVIVAVLAGTLRRYARAVGLTAAAPLCPGDTLTADWSAVRPRPAE